SLVKADLRGVCARGARLNNADMLQADLREGQLLNVERSNELKSLYVDIPEPGTNGMTDFSKTKMKKVRLSETQAGKADFSDAEMNAVKMRNAHMRNANFTGANLENSDFSGADFSGANLTDAVLVGVNLQETRMDG